MVSHSATNCGILDFISAANGRLKVSGSRARVKPNLGDEMIANVLAACIKRYPINVGKEVGTYSRIPNPNQYAVSDPQASGR